MDCAGESLPIPIGRRHNKTERGVRAPIEEASEATPRECCAPEQLRVIREGPHPAVHDQERFDPIRVIEDPVKSDRTPEVVEDERELPLRK
jgi:hypothetical protein